MSSNAKTSIPKAMPIIYEICRIARIRETVNELTKWRKDNSQISPGLLIESMVIAMLTEKIPLWRLEDFWKKQDQDYFFKNTGITPEQLNDDAYARALDKLAEVEMKELVGIISLCLLKAHNEIINRLHFDTTSVSVEGKYEGEVEKGEFNITFGHSKDLRPDLKQFKIGIAVQQSGLPVMGELLSGNKSDREWNPEAVKEMSEYFQEEGYKDIIYIGDSATVSSYDSLEDLKKIKFISRFPDNFSIVGEVIEKALLENDWQLDNSKEEEIKYRAKSYIEEIKGNSYRLIVINSKELRAKKEKSIKNRVSKNKILLENRITKLEKKKYESKADAEKFLAEFQNDKVLEFLFTEAKVVEQIETKFKKKGRPKKNEQGVEETNYVIKMEIKGEKEKEIREYCDREGCFVLITSLIDEKEKPDFEILEEYKGQNSVETAFKFLKDPVYLGQVFLKKKKRIEALGYVFILVLLIASYFEYRIRKFMKENDEYLDQPNGSKNQRPTLKTLMRYLNYIVIIVIDGNRYLQQNFDETALQIIRWAGFTPDIYLKQSVFGERGLDSEQTF